MDDQYRIKLYQAGIFQRLDGDRQTTRNANDIIGGQTILIRRGMKEEEHDNTVAWISHVQEILDSGYHAWDMKLNISN